MDNRVKYLQEVFKKTAGRIKEDYSKSPSKMDKTMRMLKNEYGHLKKLTEAVAMSNVTRIATYSLPIVKKILPKLIAGELVSLQPIDAPDAYIRYLKYTKRVSKGVDVAGSVIPENIIGGSGYAGKYQLLKLKITTGATGIVTAVDFVSGLANANYHPLASVADILSAGWEFMLLGNDGNNYDSIVLAGAFTYASPATLALTLDGATTDAVITLTFDGATAPTITTAGLGLPASAELYLDINVPFEMENTTLTTGIEFNITQLPIHAEAKQLIASITLESLLAGQKMGIEGDAELVDINTAMITVEMDRWVIQALRYAAWKESTVTKVTLDGGAPTATPVTIYTGAEGFYSHLLRPLTMQRNDILAKSFRGRGNFLVMGLDSLGVLEMTGKIKGIDLEEQQIGEVGILDNKWKVFCDVIYKPGEILHGYRGKTNELNAGGVFAPFIPVMLTPPDFRSSDFTFNYGVFTMAGVKVYDPTCYGIARVTGI